MCVLPVPGAPCSSTPRLRCWPLASSRPACLATPSTCRSMPSSTAGGRITSAPVQLRAVQEAQQRPRRGRGRRPRRRRSITWPRNTLCSTRQLPYLVQHPLRRGLVAGGHLQADLLRRPAVLRPAQQQREPGALVVDQVEAALDAGAGPAAWPGGQRAGGHAAHPGPVAAGPRLGQVGQPELRCRNPVRPARSCARPPLGQPGVQACLDVHVVVARPRAAGHRHGRGRRARGGRAAGAGAGASSARATETAGCTSRRASLADVGELGTVAALGRWRPRHPGSQRRVRDPAAVAWHASRIGARRWQSARQFPGGAISASAPGRQSRCPAGRAARRPPRRRAG